jgi:hypothetical protein
VPLFTVIWFREIIREIISAFRGFQTLFFAIDEPTENDPAVP